MIPQSPDKPNTGGLAVQDNGLPEGVKILAPAGAEPELEATKNSQPEPEKDAEQTNVTDNNQTDDEAEGTVPTETQIPPIVHSRKRISATTSEDSPGAQPQAAEKAKPAPKRKRGRPKAGRLDVPLTITPAISSSVSDGQVEPDLAATAASVSIDNAGVRTMSDIAPRAKVADSPESSKEILKPSHGKAHTKAIAHSTGGHTKRTPMHKVGVAPLHYKAVFSLAARSHMHRRMLGWAMLASLGLTATVLYSAWLIETNGLHQLAFKLQTAITLPVLELAVFALLYYMGRNIGQSAITYATIRDVDHRPIAVARQFGVAINTFWRHLGLDLAFGIVNLLLLSAIGLLIYVGGVAWPVSMDLQVVGLFCAFLFLLYIMAGLALARGLAGAALTMTTGSIAESVKLGWQLFSHRFELLSVRFLALAMEVLLALPLAVVALLMLIMTPTQFHWATSILEALLAFAIGTLIGVGTASWWASLYRRIVTTDRPNDIMTLLNGRPAAEANSGALAAIVGVTAILICAAIALPWLKFF